jgi:hypothetical protein
VSFATTRLFSVTFYSILYWIHSCGYPSGAPSLSCSTICKKPSRSGCAWCNRGELSSGACEGLGEKKPIFKDDSWLKQPGVGAYDRVLSRNRRKSFWVSSSSGTEKAMLPRQRMRPNSLAITPSKVSLNRIRPGRDGKRIAADRMSKWIARA